jgi:putative ABC transport system permease protein
MAGSSFLKDFLRTLGKSLTRFLSIVAIIALGVGFFAGITATEPDMILSADRYYQKQNLADFSIISPIGFVDEDIDSIAALNGVQTVQEGYFKDIFLTADGGSRATVRLSSYAVEGTLNKPLILEGRLPQQAGEIALESGVLFSSAAVIDLGSTVSVSLPNGDVLDDSLVTADFTVVGKIQSPLYISFDRGQTNIGDGTIDYYALTVPESFTMARFVQVYVRTTDSASLMAYTEQYERHLDPLEASLASLGKAVVGAKTQQLRTELNEGKAELLLNKRTAEQELADAKQQLLDAELEIFDGETELDEQEARYTEELKQQKAKLEQGRSDYHAGMMLYYAGYDKWLDGYTIWQTQRDQLNDAKMKLDDAKNQIDQGERELASAKTQLDAAKQQLALLDQTISALRQIRTAIPAEAPALSEAEFNRLLETVRQFAPELAAYIEAYYNPDDPAMLQQLSDFLDSSLAQLERSQQEANADYAAGVAEYEAGVSLLAKKKREYEEGRRKVDQGFAQLNAAKADIDAGKTALDRSRDQLNAAKAQIDAGELALIRGELKLQQELQQGRETLEDARTTLAEARVTYEREKEDALAKIAAAEDEIREAERQLVEIPVQWFVYTRAANPGYSGFGDDARRIGAVARVFPFFFFLVAALVCLTTMTRMVEEERMQIGTLKALGYSSFAIAAKYLLYALLASLIGAVIGLFTGFWIFPATIMRAYGIMYQIPEFVTPPHLDKGILSVFLALGTTVTAALAASLNELRAVPAVLMQPRAPRPGKRIFLEYVQPIWRRLSFSQKLAARNVFRYKQRLLMTVIGIAGCTALLLTGFGLKDSINAIVGKQFDEIFLYDGQLMINTDKAGAEQEMEQMLSVHPDLSSYLKVLHESVTIIEDNASMTHAANLVIPEDADRIGDYYSLHERLSGNDLSLYLGGAIISEKLAGLLNLRPGDTLTFTDSENRTYSVPVSGIMENYLTHYIFMSAEAFDRITFRTPPYNGAVFNLKDARTFDQKSFQEGLLANETILGSFFTGNLAEEFSKTIGSLNLVVLVLIISAGALAFVVLYNLISINITERIREIATIKVLGFRDLEVSAYVFRENVVLTVLGTLAGLLTGVFLHRYVMDTMEIDTIMFGKAIHWSSYLLSVLLTMVFSVLVNAVMHGRLRRIKMVESLKSVE